MPHNKKFGKLGLPPMSLAESCSNGRESFLRKIYLPIIKAVFFLLTLIFIAVVSYLVINTAFGTTNTEIIIIRDDTNGNNITIHAKTLDIVYTLKNKTLVRNKKRKKRNINHKRLVKTRENNNIDLTDIEYETAKKVILSHDVICKNNHQKICMDLVNKLDDVTHHRLPRHENNNGNKHLEEQKLVPLTNTNKLYGTINHGIEQPTKMVNVQSLPTTQMIEHPFIEPTKMIPNNQIQLIPVDKDCLINKMHGQDHSHFLDTPQNRNSYHEMYPAYEYMPSNRQQNNDEDSIVKVHHQDIDILMSNAASSRLRSKQNTNTKPRDSSCLEPLISCLNDDICIERNQWCNGKVDCPDASDETDCNCKSRIDKFRLCDGFFDCPFGEDENGCYGCAEDAFSCEDLDSDGQSTCFSKEERCNNIYNCPNRRDESDCNVLAPSLHDNPIFSVSHTEGFLQRNFKGKWFAVCKNPYDWAHEACRRETGLIIRPPYIQLVPVDPSLSINYLNTAPGGIVQFSDSCLNSSAVYVTCPDLLCGTRILTQQQLMKENAAIENHLFGRNKRFLRSRPLPLKSPAAYIRKMIKPQIEWGERRGKRMESRVVGGKASQPAAWPWMVALHRNGVFHCGGVIFTQSWVISAAHCVHKYWENYYEVKVGMLRRLSFSPQEQSHWVSNIIVNHKYNKKDMANDLSILKVKPMIQFSRWVRPICLPSADTAGPDWLVGPKSGTVCMAVGWGATEEGGPDPDHMREVEVPVWDKCKHREDIKGKEICAGLEEGGRDTCQGDSGGPLLCRNPSNPQQWYMAGIVSHGDGCARKDEPGVYTKVSLFVDWIRYHITSGQLPRIKPKQECFGFRCTSGISKCLPLKRKCDKVVDCLGGEDEVNCDKPKTVFDNIFAPNFLSESIFSKNVEENHEILSHTKENNNNSSFEQKNPMNEENFKSEPEVNINDEKLNDNLSMPINNVEMTTDVIISTDISFRRGDSESSELTVTVKPLQSDSLIKNSTQDEFDAAVVEEITSKAPTSVKEFTTFSPMMNEISTEISVVTEITVENMGLQENQLNNNHSISNNHSNIVSSNQDGIEKHRNELSMEDIKKSNKTVIEKITKLLHPANIQIMPRKPKEFECQRIFQVLPFDVRCDQKPDCEDGTDELGCSCIDYLFRFQPKLICNGFIDCADGQDEFNCHKCPSTEFLCKGSQLCLPEKHVCDGNLDCPHREDEMDCITLSNGKNVKFNEIDGRPQLNMEGYFTKRRGKRWDVLCDDQLNIEQQEENANKICRYLGFSSANRFIVKNINIKNEELVALSSEEIISKRNTKEHLPVHFAYRKVSSNNEVVQDFILKNPLVIKEECVPNVTKTCLSLYVFCDHSLFTDFDVNQELFLSRDASNSTMTQTEMWPWVAKVYVEGLYKCTGTLLTLSWVLVNQACLRDSLSSYHYVSVLLGSHNTLLSSKGFYEQIYQVDGIKDIYRSKVTLLHLKDEAYYSPLVKPMVVTSYNIIEDNMFCVAIGQDDSNNTVSVFLKEIHENCDSLRRCFTRISKRNICQKGTDVNVKPWAGIISCHSIQGWFPAATFVDEEGECSFKNLIVASDIGNIKNDVRQQKSKFISNFDEDSDTCEGVRCPRGTCISLQDVCNGVPNCENGKDENEESCATKENICSVDPYYRGCDCASGEMKCHNGRCISKKFFKDGKDDCGDGTDEPGQTICKDYLARVKPSHLCDGILHCEDRSDEDPMFCKCHSKFNYKCRSSKEFCVSIDVVCDGVKDCPNGDDEDTCTAISAPKGTPHGIGQVIANSHGIWHSKCFSRKTHTKQFLEKTCRDAGFLSGHAKQLETPKEVIYHPRTKIIMDQFSEVVLNKNTKINLRSSNRPIASLEINEDMLDCHPVFIECV